MKAILCAYLIKFTSTVQTFVLNSRRYFSICMKLGISMVLWQRFRIFMFQGPMIDIEVIIFNESDKVGTVLGVNC